MERLIAKISDKLFGWLMEWAKNQLLKPEEREHDKVIFKKSETILGEGQIKRFLVGISDGHYYEIKGLQDIQSYIEFFQSSIGNSYLDKGIQKRLNNMLQSIFKVLDFEGKYFKNLPGGDHRKLLATVAEWQPKHWKIATECEQLADNALTELNNYRKEVLIKLKV